MKKIITLLLTLAVISGMAFADNIKAPKATDYSSSTSIAVPVFEPTLNEFNTPKYPGDAPLLDAFIDTVRDATFSFYGYVTPVVYEPNSKTLIEVQNFRYVPQGGSDLHGSLYIKTSQNNGLTWSKNILYDKIDNIAVWPSIAVLNTENKTNPKDFNYVITGPIAIKEGTTYPWAGDIWLIAEGAAGTVDDIVQDFPIPGQRWFWTRAAANVVSDNEVFYNVGTLSSQSGYQYGYYGSSAFNLTMGDFNAQESPAQWAPEKFKPSTDIGSSYNDHLYIDVDNAGGTYVGVKNMFVDDQDNRVPAVSKSEDGGITWSEFDRMPATLMRNYYAVYGGDADHSFMIPYSSDGFVVWGVDKWSFIFRVVINKGQDDYEFHVVEVFKNGAWGIRKIADWSGFNQLVMNDVGESPNYKDSIQVSRLGNELQIVRTADSKFVVAKWIDYTDSTLAVEPPVLINGGLDTLSKIQSNDVFMAIRDVSKTNWSEVYNVTDNAVIDKCTYLPLIIPDLEHVPLFQLFTFSSPYTDPSHPRNSYPANAWSLITDTWQGVGFTMLNLTGEVSVEEEDYNFTVNEVYPNPAQETAEFTFNLDNSSQVVVEVYNSLGQKVASVLNQFMGTGIHGININVSNYVTGTYYIRMTSNGHSITKSLSVLH